jgi:hypothetical protein
MPFNFAMQICPVAGSENAMLGMPLASSASAEPIPFQPSFQTFPETWKPLLSQSKPVQWT